MTVSEAIAQHAADVAGQLAAAADEIAQASEDSSVHIPGAPPGRAGAAAAPDAAGPKAPPVADASPRAAGEEKSTAEGRDKKKDDHAPDAASGPKDDAASKEQAARKDLAAPKDAAPAPRTEGSAPARPRVDPQAARDAADRAKHEAEKARESAEKAKEAARKVPAATHGGSENDTKQGKGRP